MPRYINNPVPQSDGDAETRRAAWEEFFRLASRLEYLEDIISNLVPAGYGGGEQLAVVTPFTIPAAAFITLPIDTLSPTVSKNVTVDLATDSVAFATPGRWRINFDFTITAHDVVATARVVTIRVYNQTQSKALTVTHMMAVQGGVEDTCYANSFEIEIPSDEVSDKFTVDLGLGGTAVTGGQLVNATIQVNNINEFGLLE